jgi:hypothetical protein
LPVRTVKAVSVVAPARNERFVMDMLFFAFLLEN